MEDTLRELLDKIYELEGLVHLALKRDVASSDFLRLISKKGKEVDEICKILHDKPREESHQYLSNEDENDPVEEIESLEDNINTPFVLDEYSIDEEIDKDFEEEEIENSKPIPSILEQSSQSKKNGKLVFSINERFRFKKELFDDSDADFNTTLALVASMDNYEEAEDFFVNEEGFDRNQPVVKEFMAVLKRYFNE